MSQIVEQIIIKLIVDNSRANTALKKFDNNVKQTDKSTNNLTKALKLLGGIAVVHQINRLGQAGLEASIKFEALRRSLKNTLGSAEAAESEIDFLRQTTEDLGLELVNTAASYSKFLAATKGTAISAEETREIFLGLVEASSALGLSASDAEGALRAIQQIASKGRVSLEELTGQLGERLPGALQLAAKSMGLSQQELIKLVETGEVLAEDLLPKLGKALRTEFGDAAKEAAGDSAQAQVNRLKNRWNEVLLKIGELSKLVLPFVEAFVTGVDVIGNAVGAVAKELTEWDRLMRGLASSEIVGRVFTPEEAEMFAKEMGNINAEMDDFAIAVQDIRTASDLFDEIAGNAEMAANIAVIKDELNFTEQGFDKVSASVKKFLEEGKSIDDIIISLKSLKEQGKGGFLEGDFKDLGKDLESIFAPLDELSAKLDKDLNSLFTDLIKNAEEFKKTFDLGKELGLTRKEFEQISGVLDKARKGGFTKEEIRDQVAALRIEGVLGGGGKDDFKGSTASTNLIAGSAAGSAFLQGQKLSIRNADANERTADSMDALLEELRENGLITGSIRD